MKSINENISQGPYIVAYIYIHIYSTWDTVGKGDKNLYLGKPKDGTVDVDAVVAPMSWSCLILSHTACCLLCKGAT